MTPTKFHARIENGKVIWNRPGAAKEFFAGLEGQRVTITVEDPQRTLDQNKAFHALCNELADFGYTPAQWKAFFKAEYLADPCRSSADLSVNEMSGLLEYSACWVAEHLVARPRRVA